MNSYEKEYLLELINNDKPIPQDMKYTLFPELKKEYELVYAGKMRKEDILANEDGTFPLPLQIDRIFANEGSSDNDDWKNLIVFGDNLQFLKTIHENRDPLIKDKVKGKVKLIYIDPPFATQDEFQNNEGVKAYNDKKIGAEFLEFLRRRLVIASEILSDDGCIYVHLDQKMGHYVKVILDEIFGKNSYKSEIIWKYFGPTASKSNYPKKHDTIYFYAKSNEYYFDPNATFIDYDEKAIKRYDKVDSDGRRYKIYYNEDGSSRKAYMKGGKASEIFEIPFVQGNSNEREGYPTQKPEELLSRIFKASTKEGDLIMDFFGGSGTSMAVAEKLGRKWITCDIGKLSFFTMQRRLLNIAESKDLEKNGSYSKNPKPFMTCKLGMYDLKETLSMGWANYREFVSQLFEFNLIENAVNGVPFDGLKRGYPVKIFNFNKYEKTKIDNTFLENLSNSLGISAPKRVYIVSPATRVLFLADYEEIKGIKYYFLNVPYEMIKELHKEPFVKLRQPKSKSKINEIEEMKGFQFIDKPEVLCKLVKDNENVKFIIDDFISHSNQTEPMESFTTLSSIYVNYDFNSKFFVMDDFRFWDEIESTKKNDSDTWVKKNGDKIIQVVWSFKDSTLGENPMFIISDIYGNDFTVKPTLEAK